MTNPVIPEPMSGHVGHQPQMYIKVADDRCVYRSGLMCGGSAAAHPMASGPEGAHEFKAGATRFVPVPPAATVPDTAVQGLLDEIEAVVQDYSRVWRVPYQLSANLLLLVRARALLVTSTVGGKS